MQLDFHSFVSMLWQQKPSIIILFVAGLIVFMLLVIDAGLLKKQGERNRGERRRPSSDFRLQLLPCAQRFRALAWNRARHDLLLEKKEAEEAEEAVAL